MLHRRQQSTGRRRNSLPKAGHLSVVLPRPEPEPYNYQAIREYLTAIFGEKKTESEAEFVLSIREKGNANLGILLLGFLCFWVYLTVNEEESSFFITNRMRIRCYVPDIEINIFTYEQRLNISLSTVTDPNNQYCEYEDRNYDKLLKENNFNYNQIINVIKNETEKPKLIKCNRTIKEFVKVDYGPAFDFYYVDIEFHLFCDRQEIKKWISLSYTYGSVLGTFPLGVMGDIYGRKPVFVLTTIAGIISFILINIKSVWCLLAGRFLIGIANAINFFSIYVIFIEKCDIKSRQCIGFLIFLGWPAYLFIYFIGLHIWIPHWRFTYLALGSMYIVNLFAIWYIDESPRWLYFTGNKVLAYKILTHSDDIEIINTEISKKEMFQQHFKLFKKPYFQGRIILNAVLFFLNLLVIYIDQKSAEELSIGDLELYFLWATGETVLLLIVAFLLLFCMGRKKCLFMLNGITSVVNVLLLVHADRNDIVTLALHILHRVISIGSFILMCVQLGELYPTTHRLTAIGIAMTGEAVAHTAYTHVKPYLNTSTKVINYMPNFMGSVVCTLLVLLLHETKDMDLPDKPREALPSKLDV